MLKKIILYSALILASISSLWAIVSLKNYQDINTNQIPAFVIQEGKISKQQIADFTKLSNAKNIWIISDKEDYNKATELIKQSADAISYANQVGRLDLVSMLLAVVAIIFGLAGIIGFLHIETIVKTKINDAILEEFKEGGRAQKIIREEARNYFSKMNNDFDQDGEVESDKYYEELFKRKLKEIKKIDNK